jgi:fatty acid desaturase
MVDILAPLKFKQIRNYSLTGPERERAIAEGLAGAEWYKTPVDRKLMKELMKRSDGPALRDTALWLGLLVGSGALLVATWGTWWALPVFIVYSVLYGSASDARWHEMGHGTAFKTSWMNDVVYEIASFMQFRNSVMWRYSHARHHTDTYIVGRDPEIGFMRPPQLILMILGILGITTLPYVMSAFWRQARGKFTPDEADYVPEAIRPRAIFVARVNVAIYAAVVLACVLTWSLLPAFLIGLPRVFGVWMLVVYGLPQHAGLDEDVLDHRLNSRTVLMSWPLRFLYMNMNYHVEHHMYPMVPFYNLPRLHEAVKHDMPAPNPNLWHAWKEIVPALIRQVREPGYFIRKELPPGAGRMPEGKVAAE